MGDKFLLLTRHCDRSAMERLFERIQNLEDERTLDWMKAAAKRAKARPRKTKRKA